MKFVITVGREYGSGGRFVGKLVAERLGIPFYDSELLVKAAKDSGLSEAIFKSFDEKKDGFLGSGIGLYSYDMSLSQKVFLAQFDTIKNNWVEGDVGATNVLNNFEQQYLTYKNKLEEGADIIQRFLNEVDAQIDRYASAETNVNSTIG